MKYEIESFKAAYRIYDGYVEGNRIKHFEIDPSAIEYSENETEFIKIFVQIMREDFEQNVYPLMKHRDVYLKWCGKVLESRKKEE